MRWTVARRSGRCVLRACVLCWCNQASVVYRCAPGQLRRLPRPLLARAVHTSFARAPARCHTHSRPSSSSHLHLHTSAPTAAPRQPSRSRSRRHAPSCRARAARKRTSVGGGGHAYTSTPLSAAACASMSSPPRGRGLFDDDGAGASSSGADEAGPSSPPLPSPGARRFRDTRDRRHFAACVALAACRVVSFALTLLPHAGGSPALRGPGGDSEARWVRHTQHAHLCNPSPHTSLPLTHTPHHAPRRRRRPTWRRSAPPWRR